MRPEQPNQSNLIDQSLHQDQASPSPTWRRPDHPTAHDRFRRILRDHWHHWCDLRPEVQVPPDQRAYLCKTIERMVLCRDPSGGYALYICPGCKYEHRVPFSWKTRFCSSCDKVRVDNWVNDITRDLFDVPHPHLTHHQLRRSVRHLLVHRLQHRSARYRHRSALDFISRLVPHIPPKGMQVVRYAGLYARNVKRKLVPLVHAALDALRLQIPLFDLESLAQTFQHLKWRERIKQSFGYDPLECPRCRCIMQLAEIWEPKRGHIWMKRWHETHRMRRAARQAMERIRAQHSSYRQLAFDFNFET